MIDTAALERVSKELSVAFEGVLSWKWDSRFETVLAEFGIKDQAIVRAVLERYFTVAWDRSTIGKAPDSIRTLASNLGGIRSGQVLFTSDPTRNISMFGAWWPWGDGQTISIRVAPFDKGLSSPDTAKLTTLFKGWFGV